MPSPERAIILAAGKGERLMPEPADRPKALLQVGGETILECQIRALRRAGVQDIAIVTGHKSQRVQDTLGAGVTYFHNERHHETNSLYSLWLAQEFGQGGCLILNSDVLFHHGLLDRLLNCGAEDAILVDFRDDLGEEEMKVIVQNKIVAEISKDIDPHRAEGENLGLVKIGPDGAKAVFDIAASRAEQGEWNLMVPHAVEALIGQREFKAVSACDLPWIEIDYLHDLQQAREVVYPKIREALDE